MTPEQKADFDRFLEDKECDNCIAIIESVGDKGFETEALFLHQSLNRAIAEWGSKTDAERTAWIREKILEEDMANIEDPLDVADRSYPRE